MITMWDVMRLPCMQGARVVAGHSGMNRRVQAVSVLEYTDPTPMQASLFRNLEIMEDELAISAMVSVKDDPDAQCDVIRRLSAYGDVGMLLYYVGVFVQEIDEKVRRTADELNFVLVCMPENDATLRYSDAISEIMNAVFRDETSNSNFVTEILRRVSELPPAGRSMDAMLRMLAERTGTVLELRDSRMNPLNRAICGGISREQVQRAMEELACKEAPEGAAGELYYARTLIRNTGGADMTLVVLQACGAVAKNMIRQLAEAVQLYINIWSEHHGRGDAQELLRAILMDEPMKTHQLARQLSVDLQAMQGMLVIRPGKTGAGKLHLLLEAAEQQFIAGKPLLTGAFEGHAVLFARRETFRTQHAFMNSVSEAVRAQDPGANIYVCYYLPDGESIRQAWSTLSDYADLAVKLYPEHRWFSLQDVQYAAQCAEIIAKGEQEVRRRMAPLAPLDTEEPLLRRELYQTLAVYLLDCAANVGEAAKRMFLHRNTIKYRLHKISEDLGYPPDLMPEMQAIYRAVALRRLLGE